MSLSDCELPSTTSSNSDQVVAKLFVSMLEYMHSKAVQDEEGKDDVGGRGTKEVQTKRNLTLDVTNEGLECLKHKKVQGKVHKKKSVLCVFLIVAIILMIWCCHFIGLVDPANVDPDKVQRVDPEKVCYLTSYLHKDNLPVKVPLSKGVEAYMRTEWKGDKQMTNYSHVGGMCFEINGYYNCAYLTPNTTDCSYEKNALKDCVYVNRRYHNGKGEGVHSEVISCYFFKLQLESIVKKLGEITSIRFSYIGTKKSSCNKCLKHISEEIARLDSRFGNKVCEITWAQYSDTKVETELCQNCLISTPKRKKPKTNPNPKKNR